MRVIYKYELDPVDGGQYSIPKYSYFLSLQMQNYRPVMWWSVPKDESELVHRTFLIAPTGPPGYSGKLYYVGTFQLDNFVGHVLSYEKIPRPPLAELSL